jgi:hypothetical protein
MLKALYWGIQHGAEDGFDDGFDPRREITERRYVSVALLI